MSVCVWVACAESLLLTIQSFRASPLVALALHSRPKTVIHQKFIAYRRLSAVFLLPGSWSTHPEHLTSKPAS